MGVEITRRGLSAADLQRKTARAKDAKASRRMLALAFVLDGRTRTEAAESCGMDRQTLRDWVHRYNAEGLAGLVDRPLPGRTPMLSAEQMSELAAIVEAGPDPAVDGCPPSDIKGLRMGGRGSQDSESSCQPCRSSTELP